MKIVWQCVVILALLTLVTGVVYPLFVTGVSQLVFRHKSNGSLMVENNKIKGSYLLAQKHSDPKYFWPRPSAADYATVPSGASNLGPTSKKLKGLMAERKTHPRMPEDLITTSGSGLDPHISPAAAKFQLLRVASARGLSAQQVKNLEKLVEQKTEGRQFGIFGEPRVNVNGLNLALDSL